MSPSRDRQIPANAGATFGERLKYAQTQSGLTNEELAGRVGVRLRLLQRWRAGDVHPNGANVARLCAELDRPIEWFYADHDATPEQNGKAA